MLIVASPFLLTRLFINITSIFASVNTREISIISPVLLLAKMLISAPYFSSLEPVDSHSASISLARLGFLPESYRTYGEKAIDGICKRYLKEKNGEMSLGGICLVAGLGGKDNRPGTYDYYMSEPVVEDDAKGVGPFLLAYTELLRYKKN